MNFWDIIPVSSWTSPATLSKPINARHFMQSDYNLEKSICKTLQTSHQALTFARSISTPSPSLPPCLTSTLNHSTFTSSVKFSRGPQDWVRGPCGINQLFSPSSSGEPFSYHSTHSFVCVYWPSDLLPQLCTPWGWGLRALGVPGVHSLVKYVTHRSTRYLSTWFLVILFLMPSF